MKGHIDAYLDVVSYYSYLAFVYLRKNRAALESHGITFELHPIFLGGVNVGSGNKPPWTLPAKAAYGKFDSNRAKNYHQVPEISPPPFFPILSLLSIELEIVHNVLIFKFLVAMFNIHSTDSSQKPQRCLCYIKANFPAEQYEDAFVSLCKAMWTPPHVDLSKPDLLHKVLQEIFTKDEASAIVAAAGVDEWKSKLTANTQKVLDQGAFGAPWFWVRNGEGIEEPFFGSDRFHFMWEFLGLPWEDIRIIPNSEVKGKL